MFGCIFDLPVWTKLTTLVIRENSTNHHPNENTSMAERRVKLPYWINPLADVTRSILLVALPAVAGCGIILFQIYAYLRFNTWTSVSLIDVAAYFSDGAWLTNPSDWHGLHSLLNLIPASVVLLLLSYAAAKSDDSY